MTDLKQAMLRLRSRLAFPALAVAMALSTVVAGLDSSAFLIKATGAEVVVARVATTEMTAASPERLTQTEALPALASSAGFHTDVEHVKVEAWIQRFTTSLRGDFSQSLTRMDKYASMITRKLDARNMPRELIYVAMIESNFNPTARSRVGAVGMWQFMSATARQLGLRVKGRTDERKNPGEATDAALTYLSELHARFGSWYLAAAAYNSGPGTVSKALRKVTGRTQGTDADFFRILPSLPRETQEYVPKLIAAATVGSHPEQYGITD